MPQYRRFWWTRGDSSTPLSTRVLRSYLRRVLPDEVHAAVEPGLRSMGERAGEELYALQQDDIGAEPTLTRWGPWSDRIDRIELTEVWQRAEDVAAERGVVATAYEQAHGRHSRVHQMALAYLFIPSTDMYGCPLAMTDGAARTLLDRGREALVEEAVPHLTARDPQSFWTSGQWMTEITGGSDVSNTRTTARRDEDGPWRLYGRKWSTSVITANVALAVTRSEGNPDGSEGLALFYVPIRDGDAPADGIYVNRLKDKLGTRKLPTAELTLNGAAAHPVTEELRHGTRHIAPMLTVTRTWNAVTAAVYLRRGLALARDYAQKREAFGETLLNPPSIGRRSPTCRPSWKAWCTCRSGSPSCSVAGKWAGPTKTIRRSSGFSRRLPSLSPLTLPTLPRPLGTDDPH